MNAPTLPDCCAVNTRIKICCISSLDEAKLAVDHGAHALGLVSAMPSGPGVIEDDVIRQIADWAPPAVATFLLTAHTLASDIADHVHDCGTNTVQVVNHLDPGEWSRLVTLLPAARRRVQVIHVEDDSALDLLEDYSNFVHAFLLDSGKPSADVPQLGGTGRVHDWEVSARFVERSAKPVFLAGGLNETNVQRAISEVKPFGIDLCSSVREDGLLSASRLSRFMQSVRA